MLSQVTGGSFLGYFGSGVQKFTEYLMQRNMAHIIASDTHFATGPRSPKLPPCVEAAAKLFGEERVRLMVVDTPLAILENRPVEVEPPRAYAETKRWWQLWR
jgi:protein-tyrosine phosphatase